MKNEIKEFIKNNLSVLIDIDGEHLVVRLKFEDDEEAFASDYIPINQIIEQ